MDLTKFWELDTIAPKHRMSLDERAYEEDFHRNTFRNSSSRFVVTMPLKTSPDQLGSAYYMAKYRFLSLEKRHQRDSKFKKMYIEFMNECEQLGHVSFDTPGAVPKDHVPTTTQGVA